MPLIPQTAEWYEDVVPAAGGLVLAQLPEVTEKNALRDADWFTEVDQELQKAPGRLLRTTLTGGGSVRGIYYWRRTAGEQLVIHTTDRMFTTTDLITFTQRVAGLTGGAQDFIDYAPVDPDDKLLMTDHVDVPKEFDGTTVSNLTLPTGVTNARHVKFFKQRTLLFDVTEGGSRRKNRIWWSEDPTVGVAPTYNKWNTANGAGFVDYSTGGDQIVRVVLFNDTVVMFKNERIGVLSFTGGTAVWSITDFAEAGGTVFPWSVDVTSRGVVYLSYDGIRLFDGGRVVPIEVGTEFPSRGVTPQAGLHIAAVAADKRGAVVGLWDSRRQRYLLAVSAPGAVSNDRVWDIRFVTDNKTRVYRRSQALTMLGTFYRSTPLTFATMPAGTTFQQVASSFNDSVIIGALPVLVSGDSSGRIAELEFTTDDLGAAKTAFVEYGPLPKDPMVVAALDKRLKEVRVRTHKHANTSVTVKVRPVHSESFVTLPTVIDATKPDRDTLVAQAGDLAGEQFWIRLEESSQFGAPHIYSLSLRGTHSGAPRRA
jgi:hypothetical protein